MRDRAFERFFVFISGLRAGIAMVNRPLLYEELARKLARAISTGRYPVGSYLPKEIDLVKETGLSRHTIPAALEKLERAGLIRRTPHVGTRVIASRRLSSVSEQISSLSDLDRLASKNPRKLLSAGEVVVSKALAEKIRVPPGETMLRFSMVRLGETPHDPPIAWTTEYVRPEWRSLVALARENPDELMIELICSRFREHCTEVRQTIEATTLGEEAAKNLEAPAGSPALRIYRQYVSERKRILLITVSYHPADRYAFNLNVRIDGS